jgi:hypothetical protein
MDRVFQGEGEGLPPADGEFAPDKTIMRRLR